ncbi:MAG: hypothetical protein ACTXOO_04825 [Sodalis sp. (in: enterobacteria)]
MVNIQTKRSIINPRIPNQAQYITYTLNDNDSKYVKAAGNPLYSPEPSGAGRRKEARFPDATLFKKLCFGRVE